MRLERGATGFRGHGDELVPETNVWLMRAYGSPSPVHFLSKADVSSPPVPLWCSPGSRSQRMSEATCSPAGQPAAGLSKRVAMTQDCLSLLKQGSMT